jgi:hypothetical protein
MSVRITGAVLVGTAPDGLVGRPPHAASNPATAVATAMRLSAITG